MRILTGRFKDRPIPFKPQAGLRPTPDRVRKAVMDALGPAWSGLRAMDLYAGTGAMGFEMLSAGAEHVVFVESDRKRAQQIELSLRSLTSLSNPGIRPSGAVVSDDVRRALPGLAGEGIGFDRVWADPPYEKGLAAATLAFFAEGRLLNPSGWVVLEAYKKEELPDRLGRLERRRKAAYGDTAVHYYILV